MLSSHTAEIEFPVISATPRLNRVTVRAYPDHHDGRIACPNQNKSTEVKKILGYSRHNEDIDIINMDVVVHFHDPDFCGQSYALALAMADKLARYGVANRLSRTIATGIVEKQGTVRHVEGFREKVEQVDQIADKPVLFVFPDQNLADHVETLEALEARGVSLNSISRLNELEWLWQGNLPTQSEQGRVQPIETGWRLYLKGVAFGFVLMILLTCVTLVSKMALLAP